MDGIADNPIIGPAGDDAGSTNPTNPTDAGAAPKFEGPEWMSSLPEDLQQSTSLRKFKDVENLARGYTNAEKLLGRDKIPMPKTDADYQDVYAKLGCPADVKEYKIQYDDSKFSADHKAGLKKDLESFLPWAKEAGLNNRQAQIIFGKYANMVSQMSSESSAKVDAEYAAAEQAIRDEYGELAKTKLTQANRTLAALGDAKLVEAIANSGLGRNPSFVKMMIKIGEMNAEELGIDKTGSAGLTTPGGIKEQISQLQSHPAYLDSTHPEHKAIVGRVSNLFARLSMGR